MRILAMMAALVFMPVLAPALTPVSAHADEAGDARLALRYRTCLVKARSTPRVAYEDALVWQNESGGAPALHCVAMALLGLHAYADGAEKLEALAYSPDVGSEALARSALLQSGEAWLQAGQPQNALRALDQALKHGDGNAKAADDADVLTTRARALMALEKTGAARNDLDAVLTKAPQNLLARRLRAAARLAQNDLAGARRDIDMVLAKKPQSIEALLLRGQIREAVRRR